MTTKMASVGKLFHLREYDEAFRKVFSRVIHLRAEEAYPLLKEIPREPRPAIHTSQVTLPSGEALTNEPFEMKVAFRFNLSDMVSGSIDAFTASAEASGRDYGEQTMRQLLKYSGAISEAMGNAVAGKGRRFGWPVILELLEVIEIDFDQNGEPELPKMISDRDISKVVPYPPLTDADRPAYDALMARKRKEYDARRRRRTLS
jgi:hypothetical protein